MYHLRIIIGDRDNDFVQKLSNYLNSESNRCFTVHCFSDPAYLKQFLDHNPTDILLVSEEFYQMIQPREFFIVLLIESLRSAELMKIPAVFKYQKAADLIIQLKFCFSEHSNKQMSLTGGNPVECIGIYSPCGGSGKTVISLSLARQLAAWGKKTLYISLEEIASGEWLLQGETSSQLSDVLFYASKHPEKLALKLESLQGVEKQTGLNYLLPSSLPEDTWDREDELVQLLNLLKEMKVYAYIVLDFNSNYSKENVKLMNVCNQLILLTNMSSWQNHQLKICFGRLKELEPSGAEMKIVCNLTHEQQEEDSFLTEKIHVKIPYVEQLIRKEGGKLIVDESEEFLLAIQNLGEGVLQHESNRICRN